MAKVFHIKRKQAYAFFREHPFWFGLFYWSLLPATWTPWLDVGEISINSKDLVLIAVSCFYGLQAVSSFKIVISRSSWHYRLPHFFVVTLIFALLSITWSDLRTPDTSAMAFTVVLGFCSFFVGYRLVVNRTFDSLHSFLWRITVFLACLGLLYTAESYFSLGLRSSHISESIFGIERVRGPLFYSSTGYLILVPAFAFAVQRFINDRSRRTFKLLIAFFLLVTILGLGSRGALIVFSVFFLLAILILRNWKQKLVAITTIAIVTFIGSVLLFSKAETDRLLVPIRNSNRYLTHSVAWQTMKHRSPYLNLIGSGYGSYWPWYRVETETEGKVRASGLHLKWTPYGSMLYQPHSTFLLFVMELGVFGMAFFSKFWITIARLLRRTIRGSRFPLFICGVVASGLALFFDLFLVKVFRTNVLWWIYLFGALALTFQQETPIRRVVE